MQLDQKMLIASVNNKSAVEKKKEKKKRAFIVSSYDTLGTGST